MPSKWHGVGFSMNTTRPEYSLQKSMMIGIFIFFSISLQILEGARASIFGNDDVIYCLSNSFWITGIDDQHMLSSFLSWWWSLEAGLQNVKIGAFVDKVTCDHVVEISINTFHPSRLTNIMASEIGTVGMKREAWCLWPLTLEVNWHKWMFLVQWALRHTPFGVNLVLTILLAVFLKS